MTVDKLANQWYTSMLMHAMDEEKGRILTRDNFNVPES